VLFLFPVLVLFFVLELPLVLKIPRFRPFRGLLLDFLTLELEFGLL
jgi:hypothetical protein